MSFAEENLALFFYEGIFHADPPSPVAISVFDYRLIRYFRR